MSHFLSFNGFHVNLSHVSFVTHTTEGETLFYDNGRNVIAKTNYRVNMNYYKPVIPANQQQIVFVMGVKDGNDSVYVHEDFVIGWRDNGEKGLIPLLSFELDSNEYLFLKTPDRRLRLHTGDFEVFDDIDSAKRFVLLKELSIRRQNN